MKLSNIVQAKKRIDAIIEEIDLLRESDFPYSFSRDALNLLKDLFIREKKVLEKINTETTIISIQKNACSTSLDQIIVNVPFLGFILRSTNVRNGFEAFAPLLRLARVLLDPNTNLIVSSEWDYSPYIYRSITSLPGFVLIGLPAHESHNPLLTNRQKVSKNFIYFSVYS